MINDYAIRLLATQRTEAYEREADRGRLADEFRRSEHWARRGPAGFGRWLGSRGQLQRRSIGAP
jgi:hypothetical protein